MKRIFGANDANIHMLLIAGRDADLCNADLARIRWRASNISLGGFRTTCMTFDRVLNTLKRRLTLVANSTPSTFQTTQNHHGEHRGRDVLMLPNRPELGAWTQPPRRPWPSGQLPSCVG